VFFIDHVCACVIKDHYSISMGSYFCFKCLVFLDLSLKKTIYKTKKYIYIVKDKSFSGELSKKLEPCYLELRQDFQWRTQSKKLEPCYLELGQDFQWRTQSKKLEPCYLELGQVFQWRTQSKKLEPCYLTLCSPLKDLSKFQIHVTRF
jgi:hypothetical protein